MRKKYIEPNTEIVEVNCGTILIAGSDRDSLGDGIKIIDDEEADDDYDIL